MMKSSLYLTTTALPGNKIEIQNPDLNVGQSVEIVVLIPESSQSELSLEDRITFLKLPLFERQKILKEQAESMVNHYQENSEWKELLSNDIIDY
ncbi:MAG: hypothetical protein KA717_19640 [Woronichinia naegeliana WA131]|uniref:Uncharacterized protein n=1 Tax=Woronichinia naegeliana WA131 TaxID=2824559 RepID=A0A977Q0K5_9CYAN|nr:MAG: hypothetical protein KA717_19640 [Woronichinia naegeliana WA131]